MLPPTTLVTAEPKLWVIVPTWSLPPPQPEARPSRLPLSQKETRPTSPPEEANLRSCVAMEVDDEYEWMEEAGYKPVARCLSLRDSSEKDWAPQSSYQPSIVLKP